MGLTYGAVLTVCLWCGRVQTVERTFGAGLTVGLCVDEGISEKIVWPAVSCRDAENGWTAVSGKAGTSCGCVRRTALLCGGRLWTAVLQDSLFDGIALQTAGLGVTSLQAAVSCEIALYSGTAVVD